MHWNESRCAKMPRYAITDVIKKNMLSAGAGADRKIIEQVPMSKRYQGFCEVLQVGRHSIMST